MTLLAACVAALALLGATAAPAAKAAPKQATVSVEDFSFAPNRVTIGQGGIVKWAWSPSVAYAHDVHLESGPEGLKKESTYSTKPTATPNARFQHAFPTPGTYKYVCTLHTQMKLTLTVKKQPGG